MEIPIYKKTQVLKLIETPIHTVYDFMHQRMILFVLYRLFHKFHANVAFPPIYAHFLPNRKHCKYRVILVSKPLNIVWTPKKDIAQGWWWLMIHKWSLLQIEAFKYFTRVYLRVLLSTRSYQALIENGAWQLQMFDGYFTII